MCEIFLDARGSSASWQSLVRCLHRLRSTINRISTCSSFPVVTCPESALPEDLRKWDCLGDGIALDSGYTRARQSTEFLLNSTHFLVVTVVVSPVMSQGHSDPSGRSLLSVWWSLSCTDIRWILRGSLLSQWLSCPLHPRYSTFFAFLVASIECH